MLRVISAEYVDGYRIRVGFDTGETGIVDLADVLWGPMFEPLKDVQVFRRFSISPQLHTICWDNGADLAPESLHDKMASHEHSAEAPATHR